jgi:hypothetical protein
MDIHGLTRRREGMARLIKHYDAESNQEGCDDGFCIVSFENVLRGETV